MNGRDTAASDSVSFTTYDTAQPAATATPKVKPTKKKGWVRLTEDRPFGAITGNGFRVWGDQ